MIAHRRQCCANEATKVWLRDLTWQLGSGAQQFTRCLAGLATNQATRSQYLPFNTTCNSPAAASEGRQWRGADGRQARAYPVTIVINIAPTVTNYYQSRCALQGPS
jgi:hypothetical protein